MDFYFLVIFSAVYVIPLCFTANLAEQEPKPIMESIDEIISNINKDNPQADSLIESLKKLRVDSEKQSLGEDKKTDLEIRLKIQTAVTAVSRVVTKFQSYNPLDIARGCFDLLVGLSDIGKPIAERIGKAKPKDGAEAKRIISLIELLIDLISFRDVMVTDLFCQISRANHSPRIAAGINGVRKITENRFKVVMKTVLTGDDPDRWLLLSHLYPRGRSAQTRKIFKFFEVIGVDDVPGINKDLSGPKLFIPMKYDYRCMRAQEDRNYMLGNTDIDKSIRECTMNLKRLEDGFYEIKVTGNRIAYATDKYVYMSKEVDKSLSKFSFIPVRKGKDKFYLITSYEWPDKFAYMMADAKGNIGFAIGNPNTGVQTKAFWKTRKP